FQQSQRAHGIDIGRVLRRLKAYGYVRLGTEIVDLVRLNFLDDPGQVRGIRQVTVMKDEILVIRVRILIDMVNALRIEQRCATFDAMDLITLFQEELGEIGTILASNAGN